MSPSTWRCFDFPGGSGGKASAYNAGDLGSIPRWGRSSGERTWQGTRVLLPGKSHGWRSVVAYSPWGRKELDTTERLHLTSLPPATPTRMLFGFTHFKFYWVFWGLWGGGETEFSNSEKKQYIKRNNLEEKLWNGYNKIFSFFITLEFWWETSQHKDWFYPTEANHSIYRRQKFP